MSLLIETIRLCDGTFHNLPRHQRRMDRSLGELFKKPSTVDLGQWLNGQAVPDSGLFRCRVLYNDRRREVEFIPYERRIVNRLKIVYDDSIEYPFKFENRDSLNRLFSERGACDDVLIVKKGMVTDSSYANVVFRRGTDWYTPSTPLLEGTMRQLLLEERKIRAVEIRASDIRSFDAVKLVNAMLQFDAPEIDVSNIVF